MMTSLQQSSVRKLRIVGIDEQNMRNDLGWLQTVVTNDQVTNKKKLNKLPAE